MAETTISHGSELALLASLIRLPAARHEIHRITDEFFTSHFTQAAWKLIKHLATKGVEFDATIFKESFLLEYTNLTPELTDFMKLVNTLTTPQYYDAYSNVCRNAAILRMGSTMVSEVSDLISKGTQPVDVLGIIEHHQRTMSGLIEMQESVNVEDTMAGVTKTLLESEPTRTHTTGLEDIDRMGPYGNVCHLIAARYGVGKTPLAIGIAMHNALENNVPVAYWSGENSNEDIYFAMIAKLTNIPIKVLRQGIASWPEDRKKVVRDAQARILDAPIHLLPWGRRPLYQLRAGFERAAAKGAQIFVIDQITHVIGDPTIRDQNQQYDVLAEEIFSWKKHIPGWWLVLAQLKTKGVDSEPLLRDVMWATRLEQNCDVGWTIDRIEADPARREKESTKYEREKAFVLKNKSLTEPERQSILDDLKQKHLCCGRARITQAKGRMGYGTWEAMIAFDQHARGFYNLSTQDAENQPQPPITNPDMLKEEVPF